MILNQHKLEYALANGTLTSWERGKYYLAPLLINTLLGVPIYLISPRYTEIPRDYLAVRFIIATITAVILYRGFRLCHHTNQKIDDKAFIERIIVLGFPIFLRVALATMVICILLLILLQSIPFINQRVMLYFVLPASTFFTYQLLNESLIRLGRIKNNPNKPQDVVDNTHQTEENDIQGEE